MYKIIGIDQKVYGPVSAEQLRRWLAEGRLNQASLVLAEGTTDWKPLASFPEFTAPPLVPPTIIAPPPAHCESGGNLATTGLVFGLLANTCCFGFIFALVGIVTSSIAMSQPQNKNRGLALAGLILSVLGLISHFFIPALLSLLMAGGGFGHHFWRHF